MESTLKNLLVAIVAKPEDVVIERQEDVAGIVYFNISVNEEDKGLVIGRGGRTIKALQDIIAVKAVKENKKVYLKML